MSVVRFSFFILLTVLSCMPGTLVHGQNTQSLSVTPPLFQVSILPGDVWQSSVRVVNPNTYPITVYAEPVNFAPEGEGGLGRFMPIIRDDDVAATLAEWITIPEGPHMIPGGETKEITFFVDAPKDASPGGHFAAILISTEPPKEAPGTLALVTSQTVASLFFMRIEGDVRESGVIRAFSVLDRPVSYPEAEFSLRFENKGNVHIQPRGDIVIYNMWGKERGIIPINHLTHFGNVLPLSVRDFRFSWKGERSLADIGRYKAIATLGYGASDIQSTTATTYFWVVPVKGILITLGCILAFLWSIIWMVRRYVRRMLILSGIEPDTPRTVPERVPVTQKKEQARVTTLFAPIQEGVTDLRSQMHTHDAFETVRLVLIFVRSYYRFFIAVLMLIAAFILLVHYISRVGTDSRAYEVTITEGETTRTLTDDEVQAVRGE